MEQLKINELNHPTWLIHEDLKHKIKVSNLDTLFNLNKLTIKSKSMIGCYLYSNKMFYRVTDVIKKNRTKFSIFFNHWFFVDLIVERIKEEDTIIKLKKKLEADEDFIW